ncbi:pyrroloquinoline quinone biosynthesis protein [Leptospira sp. 201903070]|uniref:Pyrroloquinoline quinone biosynthesis protein n=1 Tax=Leptospira ainlahdjerensis TaxID=2810033 RepID=A0ABS2UEU0_9LEPT|nr:pyrroloquinoline quinone biosynthesis protein [Leptospira ainlahdjerensis]MBM9578909.1 pyrroloquinoline quinone biosynthesis protein [Leptospira ainlahdjerensis]
MFLPFGFFKNQVPKPTLDPAYPTGGVGNYIKAMVQSGNTIFVGGLFTSIGGQTRNRIAAIDATTGTVLSWYPTGGANSDIYGLALSGNTLYVAGSFTNIGGSTRNGIAALDATTGAVLSWYPTGGLGGSPFGKCLVLSGSTLYIGGGFTSIGGVARTNIGAVDANTGATLSWYPSGGVNFNLNVLYLNSGVLYIGGGFTSVGGQSRVLLAALDPTTASVLSWNPTNGGGNNYVDTIVRNGNTVYVGGSFSSLNSTLRFGIAAIDATTGSLLSWLPDLNGGQLTGLALNGTSLYLVGNFSTVNGAARSRIASVSTVTAGTLSWYPTGGADATVDTSYALDGNTLWIAGGFSNVGGQSRLRIAKLNLS